MKHLDSNYESKIFKKNDISVIIVTYNSSHCVEQAIHSVSDSKITIVVDNASTDDTRDVVNRYNCLLIENNENLGFGSACNLGASSSNTEFVLFLNPDASLAPNALNRLLNAAVENPDAVAFGPLSELPPESNVDLANLEALRRAQSRAKVNQSKIELNDYTEVESLSGMALMCRRTAFEKIGGFDENFFLYFEDEDLCCRLRELGPLIKVNKARAFHLNGTGVRLNLKRRFAKYRHYGHARVYFSKKHNRSFNRFPTAFEQMLKAFAALLIAKPQHAAQHLGRATGYLEGCSSIPSHD